MQVRTSITVAAQEAGEAGQGVLGSIERGRRRRRAGEGAEGLWVSTHPGSLLSSKRACAAALQSNCLVPRTSFPFQSARRGACGRPGYGPLIRAALSVRSGAWVIGAAQIPRAAPPWSAWPRTSLACPHSQRGVSHPVPLCASCGAALGGWQLAAPGRSCKARAVGHLPQTMRQHVLTFRLAGNSRDLSFWFH